MTDDPRIVPPSRQSIDLAAELLTEGKLVGVPTETVYGLAADATNPAAVRKIYDAKGRPPNNPLILHCGSVEAARSWLDLNDAPEMVEQWQIATSFWPGPLTVVAPQNGRVPAVVTADSPTVAVRVPDHPVMASLLSACAFPVAAPSANVSNYVSPTTARHVASAFGDQVPLILDGGPCHCGLESTIIRLRPEGVELLRPGAISVEQIESAFGGMFVPAGHGRPPVDDDSSSPLAAPGMLSKHYSPTLPLRIVGESEHEPGTDPASVARIVFGPPSHDRRERYGWFRCLSDTGDLWEVARELYTALRDADASDCEMIVIDRCDRTGIGRAIMDRIDRAAR